MPARCAAILASLALAFVTCPRTARAQSSSAPSGEDVITADRPGIADGSQTIGRGRIQLETGAQLERHDEEGLRSRDVFVPALLRVGIAGAWEVRVEGDTASWMTLEPKGVRATTTAGVAPTSVGIKYAFSGTRGDERRFSTGAIARVFPPSGSGPFRADRTSCDVMFVADWNLSEHWSINPNVGAARYASSSGGVFGTALGALTLSYAPNQAWNPFVDVGLQSAADAGAPASVIVDGGIGWIVRRNLQLDVSVGEGVHGPGPRPFVAAGVSVRAGRGTSGRQGAHVTGRSIATASRKS